MPATESPADVRPIPPIDLRAAFAGQRDELLAEITAICESGAYVLGPKVEAFEKALAEYCGARFAVGVSSGTDALLLALMALRIGPGDEVLVPSFSFFATAGVVTRLGARPVFCEIEADTFNLDVEHAAGLLTQRTKAVIPVHLYGAMADMREVFDTFNRHGVAVIEDAAQAIGATLPEFPDRRAGALGTFGCISFYPTKNLAALGDAGAVLTNDERLAELSRKIRIHGSGHTYYHDLVGGNFRIDALQAAVLSIRLRKLDEWNRRRGERADAYRKLVDAAGLAPEFVELPPPPRGTHVYHQFVLRCRRRDDLLAHLKSRKIGCSVYYPLPLHLQKCFESLGGRVGMLPVAERAAAEVLALPMHPELSESDQQRVVSEIAAFYRR